MLHTLGLMGEMAHSSTMPVFNSEHDILVHKLAGVFEKRKCTLIIDTTNPSLNRIPDLLVVLPGGQIQWIEVESKRYGKKRKKLKEVARALQAVNGKVRMFYMRD